MAEINRSQDRLAPLHTPAAVSHQAAENLARTLEQSVLVGLEKQRNMADEQIEHRTTRCTVSRLHIGACNKQLEEMSGYNPLSLFSSLTGAKDAIRKQIAFQHKLLEEDSKTLEKMKAERRELEERFKFYEKAQKLRLPATRPER